MDRLFLLFLFLGTLSVVVPINIQDGIDENTQTAGVVRVSTSGGFVARFYVDWSEMQPDASGKLVKRKMYWDQSGHQVTSGFFQDIYVPKNASELHVKAQEVTGLAWDWWRTVLDMPNIPVVDWREFHIYGTTLAPHYEIKPPIP